MKIKDVEQINHLLSELKGTQELIAHSERAEPGNFELFVELPGDASIKMSGEGSSSTHYDGFAASPALLERLKALALEELRTRQRGIEQQLAKLGVEVD
jgi:hypothetical protein